jgi:hypothetical protein
VAPYRWLHDARAVDLVRAIGVDAGAFVNATTITTSATR